MATAGNVVMARLRVPLTVYNLQITTVASSTVATPTQPVFGVFSANQASYEIFDGVMSIWYSMFHSKTSTSTAGAGYYAYSLPPGYQFDSTFIPATMSSAQLATSTGANVITVGTGSIVSTTSNSLLWSANVFQMSNTQLGLMTATTGTIANGVQRAGSTADLSAATMSVTFFARFPVVAL